MKFYVHHKYSSNLFWYFFHGTDIKNIPSYYFDEQKESDVEIKTTYKENDITILFCGDRYWDKLDGNHILDSHVKGMELGINSDRGYNHKFYNYLINDLVPDIKEKGKLLKDKLHFFYIDWEGYTHVSKIGLTNINHIKVFGDEFKKGINWKAGNYKNHIYAFTQVFNSFIHTSGLGIKNFYFFHDYLKHKNDYKYKLSYSIRRMTQHKLENSKEFLKLGDDCLLTYSSYGYQNDTVDLNIEKPWKEFNETIKPKLPKESFINKRGIGIHDWGSEENRNNIEEMMYKILPLAEIELIDEYILDGFITEKSIIRILAGKPFIPFQRQTISFYENLLKEFNLPIIEYPLKFEEGDLPINELSKIIKDEVDYRKLKKDLQNWVMNLRNGLIKIIESNNSYLDIMIANDNRHLI